jgi:hypothetical protein
MTLPEVLARAADGPSPVGAGGARPWIESLTVERTAGAYLRAPVPEVADPTGSARRAFEAAVVEIERQCHELATLLALAVTHPDR